MHSHQQQFSNQLNISHSLMHYSADELEDLAKRQKEQIEKNEKLLIVREQKLKNLQDNQRRLSQSHEQRQQQQTKQMLLKQLQHQIEQQRNSNLNSNHELDLLKQIFRNKEHQLNLTVTKIEELTKQLDQLRKFQLNNIENNSPTKNQLEKLKQELLIRTRLNEQQGRKIAYQRDLFNVKQNELTQLDHRIEELQQRLRAKPKTQSNSMTIGQKTVFDSVQDTLNHINIAEIEKRMVQLAQSFNSLQHSNSFSSSLSVDSPKKANETSSSVTSVKIAFASKSEIAATYMTRSCVTPNPASSTVIEETRSVKRSDEQSLPGNLRLNDDILSIHFNPITSNIKKRHSISDSNDSLFKQINTHVEEVPIQVRDDSLAAESKDSSVSTMVTYENLIELQNELKKNFLIDLPATLPEEQQQHHDFSLTESLQSDTESEGSLSDDGQSAISISTTISMTALNLKSLLKTPTTPRNTSRRVVFDPFTLLLDAAVIGDLPLMIKSAQEVANISRPNDEGLTALHNAVCAANFDCVRFLVEFGCDINYADNDGWTPLHCAASCNNTTIVQYLVEHGASIFATTIRDRETPAQKCEEEEDNYQLCVEYLQEIENALGVKNEGLVYALYDHEPSSSVQDELRFQQGDQLKILRRGDEKENEWWWAQHQTTNEEGYAPRNYLGLYPRVKSRNISISDDSLHQRDSSTGQQCE